MHGLNAVEVTAARAMPGVAGVFTAADLDLDRLPASGVVEGSTDVLEGPFGREVLARELVRFVGEAIAIVVAGTLAQAEDAAEAVVGDYDLLPAVTDVEAALDAAAPRLWPEHGSNVVASFEAAWDDDVLAGRRRGGARAVREPARGARAHGGQRDRRATAR